MCVCVLVCVLVGVWVCLYVQTFERRVQAPLDPEPSPPVL